VTRFGSPIVAQRPLVEAMVTGVERILVGALMLVEKN
jgi:hypothetical protein